MKAICVTAGRTLEVRDVPAPDSPPAGHVLVDMDACAITHGDKFFLTRPASGSPVPAGGHDVYGANGAGVVAAVGEGVPAGVLGRPVAIYKSLAPSAHTIGLWCERAQVPYASCLVLPDRVRARDLCGSLANVLTAHAFLDEMAAEGRKGVVVTAGNSATGLAAAVLAQRRGVPAVFLVRSAAGREMLLRHGVESVLVTEEEGFEARLAALAAGLEATAVFDGVGGKLLSRILPHLPMNMAVRIYGFMGGAAPISLPTASVLGRNLSLSRFTVLDNATVSDPARLATALEAVGAVIDDPLLRTRIGEIFHFDDIDQALAYEGAGGGRALLVS